MDFAGVSVRYALGEQNSKFQVGDFYPIGENGDSADLVYPKYGINNSSAIRNYQAFNNAELVREFGNNLNKDDDIDDNEGLDSAQAMLEAASKRPETNSKVRSELPDSSKIAEDILKMKSAADDKLSEETNYIVKLEKMSPNAGVRDTGKCSNHSEKKKQGESHKQIVFQNIDGLGLPLTKCANAYKAWSENRDHSCTVFAIEF